MAPISGVAVMITAIRRVTKAGRSKSHLIRFPALRRAERHVFFVNL